MELTAFIRENPIIAAVRDVADLREALASTVRAVFLLTGDVNNVADCVRAAHHAGKGIFVHLDLLEGLGRDKAAVRFLAREAAPDGIITTRSNLIQAAQKEGLYTIQRIFILDSLSIQTGIANVEATAPDAVECLPGILPRVFAELTQEVSVPVIAGGLLKYPAELREVLQAGVQAVSVSHKRFWHFYRSQEEFRQFCRIDINKKPVAPEKKK
ncbi:MAG TPA: glycerol-3-phosphate responsive antiterminator [Firmicutes bacterium]|jgi:glycerol uptake operon antiterminator|nr:glycerol uptake operon antiterminator [Bacillota bacterium]MDK2927624.1 glycerol uptake operon antiterminator [Bacillota bacterium]HHV57337.1 glycerol-3-phosphate responsive antiterminator [Bacillota bacterium]